jgi:outer membrane protein assembly factor BamB
MTRPRRLVVLLVAIVLTACGQGDSMWSVDDTAADWVTGDAEVVVTSSSAGIIAREPADGAERWSVDLAPVWAPAVGVGDGLVAVVTERDEQTQLCGLDATDGQQRWCTVLVDGPFVEDSTRNPVLTITPDAVVVTVAQGLVFGVDPADGILLWEQRYAPEDDVPAFRPQLLGNGATVALLYAPTGQLTLYDAASGQLRDRREVAAFLGPGGLGVAGDGFLVDARERALRMDTTGATTWDEATPLPPAGLNARAAADPVLVGDTVVVAPQVATPGPEGFTVAGLDASTGAQRWQVTEPPPFTRASFLNHGRLLVVEDRLVLVGADLHVLDPATGEQRAEVSLGRDVERGAAVIGDTVVVLDGDGRLRRIEVAGLTD